MIVLDFSLMINYHKIAEELGKKIKGEISFEEKDLEAHAKDASLFYVKPQMIIYPKDKFDIVQIVKYVNGLGGEVSLTARAAGTCMSGGSLNDSIIIDITKYLNTIKGVTTGDVTFVGEKNRFKSAASVVCEPGVYFRDLERKLQVNENFSWMFPSYPASKDLCCVGGIVANNSAGEKTLLYGQTKDWVEEVEMVLWDGTIWNFKNETFEQVNNYVYNISKPCPETIKKIYFEIIKIIENNKDEIIRNKPKVSKNSSGYNLWDIIDWGSKTIDLVKLIVGSQGTLGIITNIKLRLIPKPKYSQIMTVFLPSTDNLVPSVEEILKYKPESLESFDDHTFVIAMRFLPTILWKMKGNIFQLAFSFIPEMWLAVKSFFSGGLPRIILLVEFTGNKMQDAKEKTQECLDNFRIKFPNLKARITKNETDIYKYWTFRRESFNLLRSKMRGFRTAPFVEDVCIPVESMKDFIPQMQSILDKNKFTYTIAGHAGNGNFHIIPLMKLNSSKEIEIIKQTNEEIFSLIQKYEGSISAEHNDGLVRTPYLHYMFSEKMLEIFKEVKKVFDPNNFFNPNKKVGGGIEENYCLIKLSTN